MEWLPADFSRHRRLPNAAPGRHARPRPLGALRTVPRRRHSFRVLANRPRPGRAHRLAHRAQPACARLWRPALARLRNRRAAVGYDQPALARRAIAARYLVSRRRAWTLSAGISRRAVGHLGTR